MELLKLVALDTEDLAILSAHLQDAVLRQADIAFLPKEKRFALLLNRFDWAKALAAVKGSAPSNERRRAALRFENVRAARQMHLNPADSEAVLSLLAIEFAPTMEPSGLVTLTFAGGGVICLEVECIEAELRDLGAVWAAATRPDHPGDETAPPPKKPAP